MPGLEWYVYVENVNSKRIERYNVFSHTGFSKDCTRAVKTFLDSPDEGIERLQEEIKHCLMYWFWSKCEWEVVITGWPDADTREKTDVFKQVTLNYQRFFDYLWENRAKLTE